MGSLPDWRKAYGAIKDSTTLGLAKINSNSKDLGVAIVKATSHVECPPKERHVRKIFAATLGIQPRVDVAYCIQALTRRLAKTRNWTVALKTLIVIHRTLREDDPTFREELLNYSNRGRIFRIYNFNDSSSHLAWDCTTWVRRYALFLEERLECFKSLKYDIEAERMLKPIPGSSKGYSRTRDLGCQDLLEQLPALQELLFRLVGCQPEGAAYGNYLIQYALALVLKESFKIYCAINDGIINLVDLFFEMSKYDAIKALHIYKRAGLLAESLSEFYIYCKDLELVRNFHFPTLREPPESFLATMEEYIKEAPTIGFVNKTLEYREMNYSEEVPPQSLVPSIEDDEDSQIKVEEQRQPVSEVAAQLITTRDLLDLDEMIPSATEEQNVIALAISSHGNDSMFSTTGGMVGSRTDTSGWELELVHTAKSNDKHSTESKLAGGFDNLLLDSLYGDAVRKQQNLGGYDIGPAVNPFGSPNPFDISKNAAAPPSIQMALAAQQQQCHQQQQNMMAVVPLAHQPYEARSRLPSTNPFVDPIAGFSLGTPQQQQLQQGYSMLL